MKRTESDKRRTDKAWEKLQSRLNKDGLLQPSIRPVLPMWKIAAALAIGILSTLSFFLNKNVEAYTEELLTIHNTDSSATQVISLQDGSIVCLDSHSSLIYPSIFNKESREVTLHGNAMFQVKGNPQCPFRIKSGSCEVEVLGTTFYIRSDGKEFKESGVRDGRIKIRKSSKGQTVHIGEGEKVKWHCNEFKRTNTTTNDFDQYTQNLRFKDEPLSHVLQTINRLSSDKSVHLEATPIVGSRRLTFTYANNTPENLAILISSTLSITYQQVGKSIIFKEQEP